MVFIRMYLFIYKKFPQGDRAILRSHKNETEG